MLESSLRFGFHGGGPSMSPKPSSLAFIDMFPEPGEGCDGDSMHAHRKRRLSEKPYIHPTSRVMKSRLGGYTAIGPHCSLRESEFGDYSYTAGDVSMVWTSVGNFCSIASHTRINPGNHSYWRVTQSHCTYRRVPYGFDTKDDEEFFAWRKADHVDIGHDVWLGHGVTVMPGAKIATGAAVGAGAVVVKAHPIGPYEIAVGIPARPIRKRFPDQVIEKLMAIEYWYWDRKTLEERFNDLLDIDVFLEKYGM